MKHRDINSFETLDELIKFLGDPNRIGRSGTWIGKNYNVKQLIIDLQNIRGRNSDGRVSD